MFVSFNEMKIGDDFSFPGLLRRCTKVSEEAYFDHVTGCVSQVNFPVRRWIKKIEANDSEPTRNVDKS